MEIIITAPSLDTRKNVSGISSVVSFIIQNNKEDRYIHFELGRRDDERSGVHRLFALAGAWRRWRRLLLAHPDALVHYSFPLSAKSILRDPWFIWAARRRKMVIHLHGGLYLTAPKIPCLQRMILKRVFRMKVPFITLSEMERRLLIERFAVDDVRCLPNCVDTAEAKVFRRGQPAGMLTYGYIGRIARTKGMEEWLEACRQLKAQGVDFRVAFAGVEENKGEFLPRFADLLGDRFRYVGIVSGEEKTAFLKDIDVMVMPTYFEGLPMSLLECMSFGVVPVVTPVGSIPEVVRDGENGVFVKKQDVESIVQAVKSLTAHPDLVRKLGENAREKIFRDFNTERYVEELRGIYGR